jgi:hypothetical protein
MNILIGSVFYNSVLHNALVSGSLNNNNSDKNNSYNKRGVYLVAFRRLKKDTSVVVYNYIYYPNIFTNTILGYLIFKSNFKNSYLFKE